MEIVERRDFQQWIDILGRDGALSGSIWKWKMY
jgi:hypothetical protein